MRILIVFIFLISNTYALDLRVKGSRLNYKLKLDEIGLEYRSSNVIYKLDRNKCNKKFINAFSKRLESLFKKRIISKDKESTYQVYKNQKHYQIVSRSELGLFLGKLRNSVGALVLKQKVQCEK